MPGRFGHGNSGSGITPCTPAQQCIRSPTSWHSSPQVGPIGHRSITAREFSLNLCCLPADILRLHHEQELRTAPCHASIHVGETLQVLRLLLLAGAITGRSKSACIEAGYILKPCTAAPVQRAPAVLWRNCAWKCDLSWERAAFCQLCGTRVSGYGASTGHKGAPAPPVIKGAPMTDTSLTRLQFVQA